MWSWTALDGSEYTGLGTHLKYYIEKGGTLTDATPIRTSAASLGTDPFTATSGSTTVQVEHTSHGAGLNDFVTYAGAATFQGIPAAELNAEHQITRMIDPDNYEIEVTTAATGSGSGGGASVTATYQIPTGSSNYIAGNGFGAGPFGGAASPRLNVTLSADPLDTTNLSTTVNVSHTAHGASTGDTADINGAAAVGGIPAIYINRVHEITVVDADNWTFEAAAAATSTATGGGSAIMADYFEEADVGWGDAAATGAKTTPRLWSHDHYGEDLVICPRDKPMYLWDKSAGGAATVFSDISGMDADAPIIAKQVIVSNARHLIAFATNPIETSDQDPLHVRWATSEDYKTWTPLTTNSAGGLRLEDGSYFVSALETRQEILVWTDTALISMQYLGPPYTYGAHPLSTNITIFGPKAMCTAMDVTFWMGTDNFYMYDGRVQALPCTVWDYVFGDINQGAAFQVQAGTNRAFNEIWWHYPTAGSEENDRYVIYNYRDRLWYFGTMARTTWLDRGFDEKPRAVDADGCIYYHEDGLNDGSNSPATALNPYIEGSPMEIGDGESFMFMWRLLPDVTFRSSSAASPTATVTITPRDHPADALGTAVTGDVVQSSFVTIERHTTQCDLRTRGRSLIYKISSNAVDVGWRQGVPRIDVRPDGKR